MGIENFVARACVQTAVYWANPVNDGYGGLSFDEPVEIDCRWDDVTEIISDGRGEQIICRAIVYVTQDVDKDGYLYLGTLDDFDSSGGEDDPRVVAGAYQIKRFDKLPALRSATEMVRKAYI